MQNKRCAIIIPLYTLNLSKNEMNSKELILSGKYRFLKVLVKSFGLIPTGQPGEGTGAWLFLDEIAVY